MRLSRAAVVSAVIAQAAVVALLLSGCVGSDAATQPATVHGISNSGVSYDGLLSDGVTDMTNENPGQYGKDWFYEVDGEQHTSLASLRFLSDKGYKHDRVSFRWERLQPTLFGPLDPKEVARITAYLDALQKVGMDAIIDLHNYGHYKMAGSPNLDTGQGGWSLGQEQLPYSAFADVWKRIVKQWGGHPAVSGWELMNEPTMMATTGTASFKKTVTPPGADTSWNADDGKVTQSTTLGHGDDSSVEYAPPEGGQWLYSPGFTGADTDRSAAGKVDSVSAWVYLDPGSGPASVSLMAQDGTDGSYHLGGQMNLVEGQWTQVAYAPDFSMSDVRQYGLLFAGDNFNGSRTVHVDDLAEGSSNVVSGLQHWQAASQKAVEAIRATGDSHTILVGGYDWSRMANYGTINGKPWIKDPLAQPDKLVYVAHHYWDKLRSGAYGNQTPESEFGSVDQAVDTLVDGEFGDFTEWLESNNVYGAVTEVGWPAKVASAEWNKVAVAWLEYAKEHGVSWWYFATGTTWIDQPYVVYSASKHWVLGGVLDGNTGQSKTIEKYLPAGGG
ncbi:MAG: endoglucanase [Microbacteriaceae bacterium]|nr:endoglucanase [Microbacteriaceae bacterium]